jgi:hypothetical protein
MVEKKKGGYRVNNHLILVTLNALDFSAHNIEV